MLPERCKLLSPDRSEALRYPPGLGLRRTIKVKEFDGGVIHIEGDDSVISNEITRVISMVITDNPGYKLIYYSLPKKIPGSRFDEMSAFLIFSKGVKKDPRLSKRLLTKKRIEMLKEGLRLTPEPYYKIKEYDGGVIYLEWLTSLAKRYANHPPTEQVAEVISAVRTIHPGYELTYYSGLIEGKVVSSATLIFEPKTNLP